MKLLYSIRNYYRRFRDLDRYEKHLRKKARRLNRQQAELVDLQIRIGYRVERLLRDELIDTVDLIQLMAGGEGSSN